MSTRLRVAVAASATACALVTAPALAAPAGPAADPAMFDDFAYSGPADPLLAEHGWTVRTGGGGPGVPGAVWDPNLVSFPDVAGNPALRLAAATDSSTTGQTEVFHRRKFYEGTYAARVHFTDEPVSGPDGDQLVQTFFTITPLDAPEDPDYGEIDFEYLPNGGWGEPASALFETTWETYRPDPYWADNIHDVQPRAFAGWHELVVQVAGGLVTYFVDGEQVATHGDRFYPETPMSINFNHWFIADGQLDSPEPRTYQQDVDWVLFVQNQTLSPDEMRAEVETYRANGIEHTDTVA